MREASCGTSVREPGGGLRWLQFPLIGCRLMGRGQPILSLPIQPDNHNRIQLHNPGVGGGKTASITRSRTHTDSVLFGDSFLFSCDGLQPRVGLHAAPNTGSSLRLPNPSNNNLTPQRSRKEIKMGLLFEVPQHSEKNLLISRTSNPGKFQKLTDNK